MKVGIFSDVHANYTALERVVRLLRDLGATEFMCAGDIVGYGPDPGQCLEFIRGLRPTAVAGNHDRGAVGRLSPTAFNAVAREALGWTAGQLREDDVRYLDSLPLVEESDSLQLVHSAPSAPEGWGYVLTAREAEDEMDFFNLTVCIIGHSHQPFAAERYDSQTRFLRSQPATRTETDGQCTLRFRLKPGSRYLVTVGSVGQPRDGDRRASCALFDTELRELSLYRVEYDIAAVQARIRAAGLPAGLAERLARGT